VINGPESYTFVIYYSIPHIDKIISFTSQENILNLESKQIFTNEEIAALLLGKLNTTKVPKAKKVNASEVLYANITSIDNFGLLKIGFSEKMNTKHNFSLLNTTHIDMYIVKSDANPE
jgi:hypothetical protein